MSIETLKLKRSFTLWWSVLLIIAAGATFIAIDVPVGRAEPLWSSGEFRSQDDDSDEEFQKGLALMRRGQFEDALKSFKRANERRGKKSAECFFGMARAYQGLGAHKNVIESSEKMILYSDGDVNMQGQAYNLKGSTLHALAEGKDQKKLKDAEAAFRQGIALDVDLPILHFNLGFTLMQQNRDQEGIAELNKYLELQPNGPTAELTQKLIDNPRRARDQYAPDFSLTTSEGEHITLEDLRGKVVVLDFWGTWCPPCVESVPSLRNLHKKFSKEPSFVLIGISSDNDELEWRAFTAKEKMIWPQYWDRDRQIQRAFGVSAFPTYIIIDHEGIVRFRSSGTSWDSTANLQDAIRKQVKIVAKTVIVE